MHAGIIDAQLVWAAAADRGECQGKGGGGVLAVAAVLETYAERRLLARHVGVPCTAQDVRQTLYDELLKLNPDKDWSFITRQIGARRRGPGQRSRAL